LLQILVKNPKHSDVPNAGIIEFLERHARDGKFGKEPLAGGIAKFTSSGAIPGKIKAGAEQRSCGAKSRGIRMIWVDRLTVAGERGVPLRSASLFVDEPACADDYLMKQFVCHSRGFFTHVDWCVHMKIQTRSFSGRCRRDWSGDIRRPDFGIHCS
jgi:hypothetical protein